MPAALEVDMRRLVLEMRMVDKKFAASIRREVRAAVQELGADHVDRVKSAAISAGLHKAAEGCYVRPNFSIKSAGVRIRINRRISPAASIYELGNRGDGDDGDGTFTNGTKGVIAKRPFFYKTLKAAEPLDEARMVKAIDIICREAGFR